MDTSTRLQQLSDTKRLALLRLLENKNIGNDRLLTIEGSNVKMLRSGSPNLFIYPATDGSVSYMNNYLPHIPEQWGVYALQTPGMDGEQQPYDTVADLAAHGIREIRRIQPSGPYHIAGNCMGGLPAYETARQLHEQGERTGLVLHLMPNFNRPWKTLPTDSDSLHQRAIVDYVYIIERLLKVKIDLPWDELTGLDENEQIEFVARYIGERDLVSGMDLEVFRKRLGIYKANLSAMLTYAPPAGFDGKVTIIAVGESAREERVISPRSPYSAPVRAVHREQQIDTTFVDADGGALFDGAEPDIMRIGAHITRIITSVDDTNPA
ncbi:thioesterase domain-containing protein [Amycolatopsis japonica]|uniref:thioesterase domain-containing protein n=1 Tax=Amycolatopsis japonica TaxID=208439 RepID=UPI00366E388A